MGEVVTDRTTSTNQFLLESAQEFLRQQLEHLSPNSLLLAAWDEFYRIYSGVIRRFILAHGLRGADVDDCAQEVWMDVAARLLVFEHPEDRPGLRAWLYTVVRSKASDLMRRRKRRPTDGLDEADHEPVANDSDPADLFEREWELALLKTVLEELRDTVSATNLRLLEMRLLEGRSVSEVAMKLGLNAEQVWYRQHRTVRKLQIRLAIYMGEPVGSEVEVRHA
jgi:RNA polymerase sigma factor (sigma-70 family)